jgi:uncharacterized protein
MNSADLEVGRNDFAYNLRKKIQRLASNFYSKHGWRKFNPKQFVIEHIEVSVPDLADVFENYSIVHISDIHYGQWIFADRLAGVVGLINGLRPDLVAITGDFVSYLVDDSIEEMAPYLKMLKPADATVAVLGNHDYWAGAAKVRKILKDSNIYDLSNSLYVVRKGASVLTVAGVDSVTLGQDQLDQVLEKMPIAGPAILLVHEPDFAVKSAETTRFNLQLSGHSHGGQFIIPKLGTPIRGNLFTKYPVGKYKVGDMIEYTNRGLGTNGYWLRINCPPEITVFNLVRGEK